MTSDETQIAESCAQEVLDCIKSFIDILRCEFAPSTSIQSRLVADQKRMLYSRMEEEGLARRVESIAEVQGHRLRKLPAENNIRNVAGSSSSIWDSEPFQLVHNIVLPLVGLLTQCYSLLDEMPPPQPRKTERKTRQKNKPAPPAGMLSIQNYTDIACLLEFLVITSILPYLDTNVMMSAQDRIQYHQPKSLAGRMPRGALEWNLGHDYNLSNAEKSIELLATATTISSLVLLDRFKPMLLPRHLSDLYAAVFQAMQWKEIDSQSDNEIEHLYRALGLRHPFMLNPVLQAKAFQVLLLRGTKAPGWLRQRISPLLSQLACTNLASIIQVFCPVQGAATASQRLAIALSGTPSKKDLVQQILGLLQVIFPTTGEIKGPAIAILETVWALLNHWSPETIRSELIEYWEKGITETSSRSSQTIHMTVRQIGALFSFVPNASHSSKLLQQLPTSIIILPQLVRLASMSSILASKARDDAKQTLHWISEAIYGISQSTMIGRVSVSPQSLLAIAWVHSLEPSTWDLSGKEYYIQDKNMQPSASKDFEFVGIRQVDENILDSKRIIDQGTSRAEVLLQTTYATHEQNGRSTKLRSLCCHIFRLLLELHLSTSGVKTSFASLSMVPIFSLPILFEQCSPEDLLLGGATNATALLSLIKTSLISVVQRRESRPLYDGCSTLPGSPVAREDYLAAGLYELKKVTNAHTENNYLSSLTSGSDDDEDFANPIPIASIMLSLLVSVLEFGSTLRSSDEEEMLVSFLPILQALAELDGQSSHALPMHIEESTTEIAGIAAYAMSLIASRSTPQTREAGRLDTQSPYDDLKSILLQSENDLRSAEPPIRARGIVELGRLARGYLGIIAKENLPQKKISLINVLEEINESTNESNEFIINFVVNETLRLSVEALGDKESYVYLAAVQTIVSVGDMQPKKLIPVVASTFVSGTLQLASTENGYSVSRSLTSEQRIKLAEALIFMIKRRAVVNEYVPTIIALMTFGDERANGSDEIEDSLFRNETHNYFLAAKNEAGGYSATQKEIWEERDVRLKTGGPIFKSEELHVVRATRASILAEVVSKSAPHAIAPTCKFLVRLINETLALETSRSVCRAITTLARELYESAIRELEKLLLSLETEAGQMLNTRASIPFTVALVSSDEEGLRSSLVTKSIGGGTNSQPGDPATYARCKEALSFRQQAEESGLFSCARCVLSLSLSTQEYPQLLRVVKSNEHTHVGVKLSME